MNRHVAVALTVVLIASCGREARVTEPPAPKAPQQPKITGTSTQAPPGAPTAQLPMADYASAMDWYRTVKQFRFTLTEGSTTVEGEMVRPAIGAERVRFEGKDGEWLGSAKRSGLVWFRRTNGNWERNAAVPAYADRFYQRVTLTFDPQKKETSPEALGAESLGGEACQHYRFTNANTGDVHDVWVSRRDGRVARISISGATRTTLTIAPTSTTVEVPNP
jgi:hypothetical protein